MHWILKHVHVNIPFTLLKERYLPRFLEGAINPEIGFDASALENYSQEAFEVVARQIHEHALQVTIHAPFLDLSAGSTDPAVRGITRRRFEQVLQVARFFHPLRIVCHAGYDWKRYRYLKEKWIEGSLKTWEWMAEETRDLGAALMLENVYEQGPEDLLALLKPLKAHGVGFCLDTGHQAAFSTTPLSQWVETLHPFLGQLHLHDNSGEWDDHMALGRGNIDFESLFKTLRDIREAPLPITLEPHQEEDLAPSLAYLEKIWPWACDSLGRLNLSCR
ncbi:MAG: sugar phosphate isomerase/epimerase family protein [Desulfatiglandales bacterium]